MRATLFCAWCGKDMGHAETSTGRPARGICDPCLLKFFGTTPEQLFPALLPQLINARQEEYLQRHLPFRMTKWT